MIVKWAVDTEAKVAWQAPFLVWKSDACCLRNYRLLPKEEKNHKNQKDSEAKKPNVSMENGRCENTGQSSHALDISSKKDSWLNKGCQQGQSSNNTPATSVNTITVKKDKK